MAHLDAGLDLLDRAVVDSEGHTLGKVDDVELGDGAPGAPPAIVALLLGPVAYGTRLGGRLGRWITRAAQTVGSVEEPIRVPMSQVADIDVSVTLRVPVGELRRAVLVEDWLRDHFIGRIPGAHREAE